MREIDKIAFPGLGIEGFYIDRTAFTVFGFEIKWYGIIIAFGLLMAMLYCVKTAKRFGLTSEDIFDAIIVGGPCCIIGSRLFYVLFSLEDFNSFYDVINIRDGGLALYGTVIMALIVAPIMCKVKKISLGSLFDMTAMGLLIGQFIGRWANFVNREAYGSITDLPWRMEIHNGLQRIQVHPTFLYESLWNVVGFILLHIYSKKRKFNGEVFLMYMAWYGFGRAMIEGLRSDSLMFFDFRISQLLGIVFFVTSVILIFVFRRRQNNTLNEESAYTPLVRKTEAVEEQGDIVAVIEEQQSQPSKEDDRIVTTQDNTDNMDNS